MSEVEPCRRVGQNPRISDCSPEPFIGTVASDGHLPGCRILRGSLTVGVRLSLGFIKVDLLEHELRSLVSIGELGQKNKVAQAHSVKVINCWVVGLRVFVLRLASVEDASNGLAG